MGTWDRLIGKSVSRMSGVHQEEPSGESMMWRDACWKEILVADGDRTKTDTGSWKENFKARKIILVKELGKFSP